VVSISSKSRFEATTGNGGIVAEGDVSKKTPYAPGAEDVKVKGELLPGTSTGFKGEGDNAPAAAGEKKR